MRRIFAVLMSFLVMTVFVACDEVAVGDKTESESSSSNVKNEDLTQEYASNPYFDHEEGDAVLTDEEIKSVISAIPCDKYEAYPDTHNVPVSATLYKDGKVISIDADDERLIKLINFFNNCVYNYKCAYTQGLLPIEYIESELECEFRLELKYSPYGEKAPSPYGRCTTMCDMIVITDRFTLISHDLPGYEGESEDYPFHAVGYDPLYNSYNWLELFGF